jgi:hypothetical protein
MSGASTRRLSFSPLAPRWIAATSIPLRGRRIGRGARYDLDHLVPLTVYPMNDLWNLVPADERFDQHRKRDPLQSDSALVAATPRLEC